MPYPEAMVTPMREELTRLGVDELRDASDVDAAMNEAEGTLLVVVNSVCGCAAANARPAVAMAMQAEEKPDRFATVFAGQDLEATQRMRDEYLSGIPPSSPFIALFRDGEPVYVVERRHIEGRSAQAIATDLVGAFEVYCGEGEPSADAPSQPEVGAQKGNGNLPGTFRSIM